MQETYTVLSEHNINVSATRKYLSKAKLTIGDAIVKEAEKKTQLQKGNEVGMYVCVYGCIAIG